MPQKIQPADPVRDSLRTRVDAFFAGLDGLGLILIFWAFAAVIFGCAALLALGLVQWNSWLFLGGLFCVQLYILLCRYCDRLLNAL